MIEKIKIVTGKIQSGKTTSLFTFANKHNSVDGILTPIISECRMMYHIQSKTIRNFEVKEVREGTISIGNYIFLEKSFKWANEKLISSFLKSPDWLIIDEVGKLELDFKGFHESIDKILKERFNSETKIILVIRDYLVNKALEFYRIDEDDYEILNM